MKKRISLLVALLALAPAAFAGLAYDFSTVTKSEGNESTMSGVAYVEGDNMRMELSEGDGQMFEADSVLLSTDAGSTILVIDETDRTYWELNVADVFNQLGAMMESMGSNFEIKVKPRKVDVTEVGDGGKVEGYDTTKYEMVANYAIEVGMMGMGMKMDVESDSTIWATPEISGDSATFFQSKGMKTGLPELDELIDQYSDKLRGFPLRTESRSTMVMMGRTTKSTSTSSVSNIREMSIDAEKFEVPAGYREVESPMESMARSGRR